MDSWWWYQRHRVFLRYSGQRWKWSYVVCDTFSRPARVFWGIALCDCRIFLPPPSRISAIAQKTNGGIDVKLGRPSHTGWSISSATNFNDTIISDESKYFTFQAHHRKEQTFLHQIHVTEGRLTNVGRQYPWQSIGKSLPAPDSSWKVKFDIQYNVCVRTIPYFFQSALCLELSLK